MTECSCPVASRINCINQRLTALRLETDVVAEVADIILDGANDCITKALRDRDSDAVAELKNTLLIGAQALSEIDEKERLDKTAIAVDHLRRDLQEGCPGRAQGSSCTSSYALMATEMIKSVLNNYPDILDPTT